MTEIVAIRQPLQLGLTIKAARRSFGLTQVQLAAKVGSYPRAIIGIERGRPGADLRLLLNVLEALDLHLQVVR